ncbi:MAG: hypothetical protein U1E23_14705 [Reyranellaceae bacterium]
MSAPIIVLRRLERWPDRLTEFVESRRRTPFAYGSNDCCSFAIDAVDAVTGTRVREIDWQDERGALRMLAEAGGAEAAVTSMLGRPSQNWQDARRGDICLVDQDGRDVPLLCIGLALAGPGVERMEFRRLDEARLVWRVG